MASACVNNIGMPQESFPPKKFSSYGWLSPRVSFSRDKDDSAKTAGEKPPPALADPEVSSAGDFEFRLEDPVKMLPADELFSDGKLVPLQLSSVKSSTNDLTSPETRFRETVKSCRRIDVSGNDAFLYSPKAPRCSSRWKELLGFKKPLTTSSNSTNNSSKTTTSSSLKYFLHRSSKSSDASLNLPLLKETTSSESESVSLSSSSRLSLSSSSEHDDLIDLPRLSLDSENKSNPSTFPNPNPFVKNPRPVIKTRAGRSPNRRARTTPSRGVSVDSPRMNSSGKIVFENLERSSSSPSSFNGGARYKNRGMERSYSTNVRVAPVLNVPVCSLSKSGSVFGLGQLFSSQHRKEGSNSGGHGGENRSKRQVPQHRHQSQQSNGKPGKLRG